MAHYLYKIIESLSKISKFIFQNGVFSILIDFKPLSSIFQTRQLTLYDRFAPVTNDSFA